MIHPAFARNSYFLSPEFLALRMSLAGKMGSAESSAFSKVPQRPLEIGESRVLDLSGSGSGILLYTVKRQRHVRPC